MGCFPQSPTWRGKCVTATSISLSLSGRASKCMSRWRDTSPTWLPIPDAADRCERLRALVECPQPLVSLFSSRFAAADPEMRKLMLEALTWRYYRIRKLTNLRCLALDDEQCCATVEYDYEGKRLHVFTTHAEYSRLAEAARAMFPLIAAVPADHDVLIDFYVFHSGGLGDSEATQQEVCSVLNQVGFSRPMRRIVASVTGPGHSRGVGGTLHLTYRPSGTGIPMKRRSFSAEFTP